MILRRGDLACFVTGGGQTRSKALAALRLAFIPVMVAVTALIAWKMGYFDLDHRQTLARAVERIRQMPGVHVVFVAVFAVAIALCLPYNVGTWVAGAVFGVWLGAALALVSGLTATVLAAVPTCLAHAFVGTQLMQGLASHGGDSRRALLLAVAVTVLMLLVSIVIGLARKQEQPH